jgi:hypothetical protein
MLATWGILLIGDTLEISVPRFVEKIFEKYFFKYYFEK